MTKHKWVADTTHSELGFKIRHLMITNVSGSFKNFQVDMSTSGDDFSTADIAVTVDLASINTKNDQRDAHLRTSDFFEVEKFPEIKFDSTKIEKTGEDQYHVFGNLTMKGITKPVKLNVDYNGISRDPWGAEKAGFAISGKIRRTDWGLNFNAALETGGMLLGEDVKIEGEIQLVKQVEAIAA